MPISVGLDTRSEYRSQFGRFDLRTMLFLLGRSEEAQESMTRIRELLTPSTGNRDRFSST